MLPDGSHRSLHLALARTLRDGELGGPILKSVPTLRHLAPPIARSAFGVREAKWLARATLAAPGRPSASGWAIHELVSFPGRTS